MFFITCGLFLENKVLGSNGEFLGFTNLSNFIHQQEWSQRKNRAGSRLEKNGKQEI